MSSSAALEFAPPRWAVPGFLAEGVNLLAGPPKVGKSWLSLGLALNVAAGTPALGSVEVEAGPVLYLEVSDADYPADRTELQFVTPLKPWPKKRVNG